MNNKSDQTKKRPFGTGSDKQHPTTPPDANERAKRDQAKNKNKKDKNKPIDEDPGSQITS